MYYFIRDIVPSPNAQAPSSAVMRAKSCADLGGQQSAADAEESGLSAARLPPLRVFVSFWTRHSAALLCSQTPSFPQQSLLRACGS